VLCSYIPQEKSVPTKTDSQICPGNIVEHKSELMHVSIPNEPIPATQSVLDTIKHYPEESVQPMKYKTTIEAIEEQSDLRRDYFQHTDMNRNVGPPYVSSDAVVVRQQKPSAFIYLSEVDNNTNISCTTAKHLQCQSTINRDDINLREVNVTAEVRREQHYETTL